MEKNEKIVKILKKGGVIVYPSETVYGLGAAATNEAAVKGIFEIKGRAATKTLPLVVGSLEMAKKWFLFNKKELALAKKFWPGPLTLILKARSKPSLRVPAARGEAISSGSPHPLRGLAMTKWVIAKDGTAAVRVSGSTWVRKLVAALGAPLVSTSANVSGHGECYSVSAVKKQLGKKMKLIDFVVDGGRLPKRPPSTIARLVSGQIVVLRKGSVSP